MVVNRGARVEIPLHEIAHSWADRAFLGQIWVNRGRNNTHS